MSESTAEKRGLPLIGAAAAWTVEAMIAGLGVVLLCASAALVGNVVPWLYWIPEFMLAALIGAAAASTAAHATGRRNLPRAAAAGAVGWCAAAAAMMYQSLDTSTPWPPLLFLGERLFLEAGAVAGFITVLLQARGADVVRRVVGAAAVAGVLHGVAWAAAGYLWFVVLLPFLPHVFWL